MPAVYHGKYNSRQASNMEQHILNLCGVEKGSNSILCKNKVESLAVLKDFKVAELAVVLG